MIRIIDMPLATAAFEPAEASETVNRAAKRYGGMKITGLGVVADRLLIFMEPRRTEVELRYVIAPLDDGPSVQETAAEINARHYAGFSTIGIFEYRGDQLGLFAEETVG